MPQILHLVSCGAERWGAGSKPQMLCLFFYISPSASFILKNAPLAQPSFTADIPLLTGFSFLFIQHNLREAMLASWVQY